MSFTHPKLDLISAPLSSFYFSAPFLGGGRWTPADVRGARGGESAADESQVRGGTDVDSNRERALCKPYPRNWPGRYGLATALVRWNTYSRKASGSCGIQFDVEHA